LRFIPVRRRKSASVHDRGPLAEDDEESLEPHPAASSAAAATAAMASRVCRIETLALAPTSGRPAGI
jgi:hypothetical protein